MLKRPKIKISILLISIIIIGGYFFISSLIGNQKYSNLKSLLTVEQKELLKKYIFPYKLISEQQQEISQQEQEISQQEQEISQQEQEISQQRQMIIEKNKALVLIRPHVIGIELEMKKNKYLKVKKSQSNIKFIKNYTFEKYNILEGFYAGIAEIVPGTGYLDFHQNNLFALSSRGNLSYLNNFSDKTYFKQIRNNIGNFINIKQFNRSYKEGSHGKFSLKDLLIYKNKIFISYTEEIKDDCWNTSVIYGGMDYNYIEFKKIFSPKECIHYKNNIDNEFEPVQSGGRMINFDENSILLSVGDYRSRHLAQDINSVNGKIIKVNIDNGNYEIISMGHRNPQGLFFDKENNFVLETEHGPAGGDEINLIEISKINKDKIQNYGWAISSAGEHYGGRVEKNKKKYEKYPLYKSHSEHGFIEPLKSFVPSIGISEIVKVGKNRYVVSSMKDKSLYFFELNKAKEIINLERVEVGERVRDLRFNNNQLYLFMENTASIGVINLN